MVTTGFRRWAVVFECSNVWAQRECYCNKDLLNPIVSETSTNFSRTQPPSIAMERRKWELELLSVVSGSLAAVSTRLYMARAVSEQSKLRPLACRMEPDSSLLLLSVSWPVAVHCQRQCYRLSRGPYSILPFLWNTVAILWIAWGIMVVNTMGLRSHTLIILMYHIECTEIFTQGGGREAYI